MYLFHFYIYIYFYSISSLFSLLPTNGPCYIVITQIIVDFFFFFFFFFLVSVRIPPQTPSTPSYLNKNQ
ncbi:hypothetical protein BDZ91DRAFT_500499 [Kalaharituber pfeilii]|nr:hypothetical protein BDZ91DRAFT_500499 [Kalaharituber pfeilii]